MTLSKGRNDLRFRKTGAVQLTLFEPPPDVHAVHNYVQATEYGLDRRQSLPLSPCLKYIHM
jgi:hypothetical protein